EKAYKRLEKMYTEVLRLHPTKPGLWVGAAQHVLDVDADMTAARSYMQRGLRFCEWKREMWVEYARLEIGYVAKIAGRRRVLGLDADRSQRGAEKATGVDSADGDVIALPSVTAEDINPRVQEGDSVDDVALQNLAATPALSGAIPIAVFDTAMDKFGNDPNLGAQFFEMFAEFDQPPSVRKILQHVLDRLESKSSKSVATLTCSFKFPLMGVEPRSADFPVQLGQSLERIKSALQQVPQSRASVAEAAILWLLPFTRQEDMDQAVRKVIIASLRQYVRALGPDTESDVARSRVQHLIDTLSRKELNLGVTLLRQIGEKALVTNR
ncbi:hypothetical protein LTS18_014642, partial [Coniosporium uncinatum]